MIDKLQSSKGKAKLNFYQILSKYYDEMICRRQKNTFHFEEESFTNEVFTDQASE